MKNANPRRGEVWVVNFNPGRGSEQTGIRPALVIQNNTGNQYAATTIVAVITTTVKPFPVTVLLSPREGGLSRKSMVNLAQLLTIDKERLQKCLGSLSEPTMAEVDKSIRISLDV